MSFPSDRYGLGEAIWGIKGSHIFLLRAVMSREALMIFSRRSWWVSISWRKVSNMGRKGDGDDDDDDDDDIAIAVAGWELGGGVRGFEVPSRERLMPAM